MLNPEKKNANSPTPGERNQEAELTAILAKTEFQPKTLNDEVVLIGLKTAAKRGELPPEDEILKLIAPTEQQRAEQEALDHAYRVLFRLRVTCRDTQESDLVRAIVQRVTDGDPMSDREIVSAVRTMRKEMKAAQMEERSKPIGETFSMENMTPSQFGSWLRRQFQKPGGS